MAIWCRASTLYLEWRARHEQHLSERSERTPKPRSASRFTCEMRASQHVCVFTANRLLCIECHALSNLAKSSQVALLRTPCGGPSRFSVAVSHRMQFRSRDSRFVCSRCRKDATAVRALRAPCRGGQGPPDPRGEHSDSEGGLDLIMEVEPPSRGEPELEVPPPNFLDESEAEAWELDMELASESAPRGSATP